jgi:hypothetical protein
MGYASTSEVQSDFKNTEFTTTSNVTIADVEGMIIEADALIDSYLGQKFVVPITGGAQALALVKLFSRTLVADRIKGILEVKQATSKDAIQNVRSGLSTADVLKLLAQIRDDKMTLAGAEEQLINGGLYSFNSANNITPIFKKEERQW